MTARRRYLLPLACNAGFLLVGLPRWIAPYNAEFPEPGMLAALAGLAAIAMMLVAARAASPRLAWLAMALCLPAATLARVIVETAADPTSHNLWPLELVFAWFVGAAAVLPGILVGAVARGWSRRHSS